jgi:hypothetical protein
MVALPFCAQHPSLPPWDDRRFFLYFQLNGAGHFGRAVGQPIVG